MCLIRVRAVKELSLELAVVLPRLKEAILVHGCFCHRCSHCALPLPRSHRDFWRREFSRNVIRDRRKTGALRREGWRVWRYWECRLKRDAARIGRSIEARLASRGAGRV